MEQKHTQRLLRKIEVKKLIDLERKILRNYEIENKKELVKLF